MIDPCDDWEYDYYHQFVPSFLKEFKTNEQLLKKFLIFTNNIQTQCQTLIKQFPTQFKIKSQQNLCNGIKQKILRFQQNNQKTVVKLRYQTIKLAQSRFDIEIKYEQQRSVQNKIEEHSMVRKRISELEGLIEAQKRKRCTKYNRNILEEELEGILNEGMCQKRIQNYDLEFQFLKGKAHDLNSQVYQSKRRWNDKIKKVLDDAVDWADQRLKGWEQKYDPGLQMVDERKLKETLEKVQKFRENKAVYDVNEEEAKKILKDFISAYEKQGIK